MVITRKSDCAVRPTHHHSFKFSKMDVQVLNSGYHPYVEKPEAFKETVLNFVRSKVK